MAQPKQKESFEVLHGRTPLGRSQRRRRLVRFLTTGMLLALILVSLEVCVEKWTRIGHEFNVVAYDLLQSRLESSSEKPLPVTVVDISDLLPQSIPGIATLPSTPRDVLQQLIGAIAEQSPTAIGVDVDFSPDTKGWIDAPHDPAFFRFCLNPTTDKRRVPVFLGVYRTQSMKPEAWLGDAAFEPLAAGIAVPNDSRKMLRKLVITGSPRALESMPLRLAQAYAVAKAPWWITLGNGWAIDMLPETTLAQGQVVAQEFVVDYSARDLIERQRIDYAIARSHAARLRDRFHRKIVIIGAAQLDHTSDVFSVINQPMTGTVIHACAAYTLVETAPLYELTALGSVLVDLSLAFFVILAIGLTWYSLPGETVAVKRLRVLLTSLVIFATILVGVVGVRTTRIMWDGFVIVLLVLSAHSSFERFAEWLVGVFRENSIKGLILDRSRLRTK